MALTTQNTDAISFKKLSGKAHTNQNFSVNEEGIQTNIQQSYQTIFSQPIESLPVTNSGLTTLYSTNGIIQRVKFPIDIIPNTQIGTNQSQAYRLKLPADWNTHPGALYPKYTTGTYLHNALGGLQIVPPIYGTLKTDGTTEYDPILYQTNGSTVITKFDSINWYIDFYNGVVFVQNPPAGYDVSASRPGFVEAFLYVGKYLYNVVTGHTSGFTSGGTSVTANNGLTKSGSNIRLGGALTGTTIVGSNTGNGNLVYDSAGTIWNVGSFGFWNGTPGNYSKNYSYIDVSDSNLDMGVHNSGTSKSIFITFNGLLPLPSLIIQGYTGFVGAKYSANYGANFTARSLVDAAYVTGLTTTSGIQSANNGLTKSGTRVHLGGLLTGDTFINLNSHQLTISGSSSSAIRFAANGGIYFPDPTGGGVYFDDLGGGGVYFNDKSGGGIKIGSSDFTGGGVSINSRNSSTIDLTVYHDNTNQFSLSLSDSSGARFIDNRTGTTAHGLEYSADYSANYSPRSLIDYGFLTGSTLVTGATNGLHLTNRNVAWGGVLTGTVDVGGGGVDRDITFGYGVNNSIRTFSVLTAKNDNSNFIYTKFFPDADLVPNYELRAVVSGTTTGQIIIDPTGMTIGSGAVRIAGSNPAIWNPQAGIFFPGDTSNPFWVYDANGRGLQYKSDYSAGYTPRSLIDYGFLTASTFNAFEIQDLIISTASTVSYPIRRKTFATSNGKIYLTNGSGNISGISTIFTDQTPFIGFSYWSQFWVNDGSRWLFIGVDTVTDDTHATIFGVQDLKNIIQNGFFGTPLGNTWSGSTGIYDFYFIRNNADGFYPMANGTNTIATGNTSYAEGNGTIAIGDYSHAEGSSTKTIGFGAHAEGNSNVASGTSSHAEGNGTIAIGNYTHTEGSSTRAVGDVSHAEGSGSIASGTASHAEGLNTIGLGTASHAEGNATIVSGDNSHAEGLQTIASGTSSHAEGGFSIAGGFYTHVENKRNLAIGYYSRASGYNTIASGKASHSGGYYNSGGGLSNNSDDISVSSAGIRAIGIASFNHSYGDTGSVNASAHFSAILGGKNNFIDTPATGATIIGGNGIALSTSGYSYNTAVSNLAIFSTPSFGNNDDILTWNSTTKKIGKIPQNPVPRTVTGNTTINISNDLILVDTTSTAIIVTLPSTGLLRDGQPFTIKDKSGNAATHNITVNPNGVNIDGGSSSIINTNYGAITVTFSIMDNKYYVTGFVN